MPEFIERLLYPANPQSYWRVPFLLLAFSLILLILAEYVKAEKQATVLTLPENLHFDSTGKSEISFNGDQYAAFIAALGKDKSQQPIIVNVTVPKDSPRKHRKRWHKTRPAGFY